MKLCDRYLRRAHEACTETTQPNTPTTAPESTPSPDRYTDTLAHAYATANGCSLAYSNAMTQSSTIAGQGCGACLIKLGHPSLQFSEVRLSA